MVIDITSLNNGNVSNIYFNDTVNIPEQYYQKTDIIRLKDVFVNGNITDLDGITLNATVTGIMVLEDSISLEEIEYPFSFEIDEEVEDFNKNSSNILDITDILWQNIILEVPLKFTQVEDFNEYQGDGWKLVDEDNIKNTNNPFKELKDMMGEE